MLAKEKLKQVCALPWIMRLVLLVIRAAGVASTIGFLAFADPMSTPASPALNLAEQPILAITTAGDHLVAAGPRGLVILSDSEGKNWRQAESPVQSDLVDIEFPDPANGWICGHDGVILHSSDGGHIWHKQLDGITAKASFERYYSGRIAAGDKSQLENLAQIHLNYDNGPSLPWLGIWFSDANTGYAVGPFGDLAATPNGGKTWQPWLDHIDNPNNLDLNAIAAIGGQIYIVGEQGMVYRLDPGTQKFIAYPTGYAGSLFGLTGTSKTLIVFGLRGTIFRSETGGQSWIRAVNPSQSSIMSGIVLPDHRIALVDVNGEILMSSDDGARFSPYRAPQPMPLSDIAELNSRDLFVAGLNGVHGVPLN
jgi:photosystem II stability/assembly factor-like uncharacterized protein